MKHTPGEWKAEELLDRWAIKAGKYVIASVYKNANNPSEAEANAKLIAASPTMYGELKRIAEVPLVGEAGYRKLDNSDAQGFIRIARATIAKAK